MVHESFSDEVRGGLASNLRRLRIARRLSLSELARATAMSKATLSGIERGHGNPTVDTLAGLAQALDVSLAELLEPPPLGEIKIVRAAAAALIRSTAGASRATDAAPASGATRASSTALGAGVARRRLESLELDGPAELYELSLPAGHLHELPVQGRGSRCGVLVISGSLIAGPVERISELGSGDYASFPADLPHLLQTARAAARALVFVSRAADVSPAAARSR